MRKGQNINTNKSLEESGSTCMDDSAGFKTSVAEATAAAVETAREREREVGPEDVTELLQSHGQT